jgi:hypothetical protein
VTFPNTQIEETVLALLEAPIWTEARRIIEVHQKELLKDEADQVLAYMIKQWQDDSSLLTSLRCIVICLHDVVRSVSIPHMPTDSSRGKC